MMTVNITPEGRTVLRHSFDKPREEITTGTKLSTRESRKLERKRRREERFLRTQALKATAMAIVHPSRITREDNE